MFIIALLTNIAFYMCLTCFFANRMDQAYGAVSTPHGLRVP